MLCSIKLKGLDQIIQFLIYFINYFYHIFINHYWFIFIYAYYFFLTFKNIILCIAFTSFFFWLRGLCFLFFNIVSHFNPYNCRFSDYFFYERYFFQLQNRINYI
jgi:hypothetical protein